MKIKITLIIIAVFVFAGVLLAANLIINRDSDSEKIRNKAGTEEQIVGGDRDKHGCIASAGYTWCEAKQECLRSWEESCEGKTTDQELIKEALVNKYDGGFTEMVVTVSQNDGQYAAGSVGSADPMGGGGAFHCGEGWWSVGNCVGWQWICNV